MRDYPCSINNHISIAELLRDKSLKDYTPKETLLYEAESIAELALLIKEVTGEKFCKLPFDHILEAECLGATPYFDEERLELRIGKVPYNKIEDVLQIKDIDFAKGRIQQILKAVELLTAKGEPVVLNVSGPFTILNGLIPVELIFRGWKKEPEIMDKIFRKLSKEIVKFVQVGQEHGVKYFSYADPLGGVNILGPKLMDEMVECYIYPLIRTIKERLEEDEMLILCPKTSLALIDMKKVELKRIELPHLMSYQEGILSVQGKCKMTGLHCINQSPEKNIRDNISEIILIESQK